MLELVKEIRKKKIETSQVTGLILIFTLIVASIYLEDFRGFIDDGLRLTGVFTVITKLLKGEWL